MRSGIVSCLLVCLLLVLILPLAGGCAADRAVIDHRAAVMNGIANQLDANGIPPAPADQLDFFWAIENERRAAVNLSDAYAWKKPTFPYPAKRPLTVPTTTNPWKPQDDTGAVQVK